VVVGEAAFVENAETVEATAVTEEAEEAETLIVDHPAETHVLRPRRFTRSLLEDTL
jgi:hypothetical protein